MQDRQSCSGGSFPIAFGIVTDVKNFVGLKSDKIERAPIDFGIGLVRAELARDENVAEKFCDAEMLQDQTETAVGVRDDGELKPRGQFSQDVLDLGIALLDAGLGEMLVSDLV